MVRDRYNCYFSFLAIFCPFNSPKNQNFEKIKKTPGDITILHKCTKNYDQIIPEICCATDGWTNGRTDRWTDGQTDGQMEKVTYRGGCPA